MIEGKIISVRLPGHRLILEADAALRRHHEAIAPVRVLRQGLPKNRLAGGVAIDICVVKKCVSCVHGRLNCLSPALGYGLIYQSAVPRA